MDNADWRRRDDVLDLEVVRDILSRMILHWNYRNLTEFPPELMRYGEQVREIYMKRNCLLHLPKDIGNLRNLTNLYLSGNQLSTLPEEIQELQNLEVLDVSQNVLSSLPASLGKLVKLEQLILTHNQLRSLPPELEKLKKLQFLELSDNQVHYVPERLIHGWEALEEFCIDRNPIKLLPRNLSFLRKLRSVSACKCDLRFLPENPFHVLTHRGSVQRGRSPRNLSDDDSVNFQFRFDGNVHLKCVPYWLLRIYGPRLESFGCGGSEGSQSEIASGHNLPFLTYSGDPKKLCTHFFYDPCLKKIEIQPEGCSLLEVALRNLHMNRDVKPNKEVEEDWGKELPSDLAQLLIIGPVSRCFQCTFPIFTQMWPLIFRLQTDVLPPDAIELLRPTDTISAYNLHYLNERQRTGVEKGFHFANINFCSAYCKSVFLRIISSSSFLPFSDMYLILKNILSPEGP